VSETAWQTLPHGELVQLAENLWWVMGDLPNMGLKRSMTVARTTTGELVLHSAIAMDEDGMAQLEDLGRLAYLVVPNGWHRLDAPRYKARYPGLQVICPSKSRDFVEKKLPVDGTYDDFRELGESVRLEHFDAERHVEGAMVVRSEDGLSLVFADSLFNLDHQPGLYWFVYGRLLGATGGPRVTAIARVMMRLSRSRKPFREYLARYAEGGEVVRLVPGHGAVVDRGTTGVLRDLVDTL